MASADAPPTGSNPTERRDAETCAGVDDEDDDERASGGTLWGSLDQGAPGVRRRKGAPDHRFEDENEGHGTRDYEDGD